MGAPKRRPTEPVEIAEYDPAWPALFERERGLIAAALGDFAVAIQHVGSTAVPGLGAKFGADREGYTVAKRGFIESALAKARVEGQAYGH